MTDKIIGKKILHQLFILFFIPLEQKESKSVFEIQISSFTICPDIVIVMIYESNTFMCYFLV